MWKIISESLLKDQWSLRSQYRRLLKQKNKSGHWKQSCWKLFSKAEASARIRKKRQATVPEIRYPKNLPITSYRENIIDAIQTHQVLIIAGETGSGKTTQIPKMCLEAGRGVAAKIACTQPRRIAATSMARQIGKELDSELGQEVGYKIRFSEKTSPLTHIQLMTDGILLNEIQFDRFLNEYDTIIIDEAHERSLNVDFLLGYLKRLLLRRPDMKLIISSANLDIPRFSEAFGNAPVIEVSGRLYPVEVRYQPLDEELEEQGEETMADAVVACVREILKSNWQGNILAFLSGEQEIREILGRLDSTKQDVEILPLYGRLSNREQNRIFQNTSTRKVILATNIAETSLTIPGIRYVIDSGQARISRYSSRSRTQRLPVEPISRSSANQRKGRAGRVQAGICIRLYSEESYQNRREYTEPEILRSSLAEVILRMMALGLGDISEFPFIDPPSGSAIREGIKLLKELGALNDADKLSSLGKEMARLPIEPRTARMLLAARREHALREVLVIASAISVQDPREYPLEKIEHARQMHSVFVDKSSDFITLLNIWDRYHEEWESLKSENKMRKFCKKHFLSFVRLREWRDIYQQLSTILSDYPDFKLYDDPVDYRAIHVSILAGYLNQIGLKKEKNQYQAPGNKEVMIFPGSGVFNKAGSWIVAAELVETSRLFARIVANIEVKWLESIGHNLCRRSYSEPHFDRSSGTVMAYEKVTLYGLVIEPKRRVVFGKINPKEATEVFIREGLVEGKLRTHHQFFKHNQALKAHLIRTSAKIRRNYEFEIESAMQEFYSERLHNIGSFHDLNGLLKRKYKENISDFLFMKEDDLAPGNLIYPLEESFPDHWTVGNHRMELEYHFDPEKEKDGVTLHLEENMLPHLEAESLDWMVPGQWEEKILFLLKSLPKRLRKQLVPLPQTVQSIVSELKPTQPQFLDALAFHIQQRYGLSISRGDWDATRLPEYLKIRVEIRDHRKKFVASGRDLTSLLKEGQKRFDEKSRVDKSMSVLPQWKEAEKAWEIRKITDWSQMKLPQRVEIDTSNSIPLYAYPGLIADEEGIHRRLFRRKEEAAKVTQAAMMKLLAINLGTEIAWLDRDLRDLREFKELYHPFGSVAQLKDHSRINLHNYLFTNSWIENQEKFDKALQQSRNKIKGLWPRYKKQLEQVLRQYAETEKDLFKFLGSSSFQEQYKEIRSHLLHLMPPEFIMSIPYIQWRHLPRYLKAVGVRAERLILNPEKDQEKAENLIFYWNRYRQLQEQRPLGHGQEDNLNDLLWMLEEFRVSLFAPELGTASPISGKRLDKFLEKLNSTLS
ncbi:MAG: ATP-dependent RNA helicase HrpA [SAR324 cluster bacterium]|nr:ATP-dependent RNA helicase HrpA [SAR324 cluster bacterium]